MVLANCSSKKYAEWMSGPQQSDSRCVQNDELFVVVLMVVGESIVLQCDPRMYDRRFTNIGVCT